MMHKSLKGFVLALSLFLISSTAFAASPWTEEETYAGKAYNKLIFGVTNLLAGWTEIITVPIEHHNEGKTVIEGMGRGLYRATVYTLGGLAHTATFFMTNWDIQIPDNGVHL